MSEQSHTAAQALRALLDECSAGTVGAPASVVDALSGAVAALEALGGAEDAPTVREAAAVLRAVVEFVERGTLEAPPGLLARLRGAVTALEGHAALMV